MEPIRHSRLGLSGKFLKQLDYQKGNVLFNPRCCASSSTLLRPGLRTRGRDPGFSGKEPSIWKNTVTRLQGPGGWKMLRTIRPRCLPGQLVYDGMIASNHGLARRSYRPGRRLSKLATVSNRRCGLTAVQFTCNL